MPIQRCLISHPPNLTMRKTHLQQLVVNMFAIGGEDRPAADEPSQNGKQGLQDRQSERHYRNRHRTNVGAFCAPARASALSMKPTNRLPESPRKIVAGLDRKSTRLNSSHLGISY